MSSLRYSPGISKMASCIPYCASIMRLENRDSNDMVGENASSFLCNIFVVYRPCTYFTLIFNIILISSSLLHVVPPFSNFSEALWVQLPYHLISSSCVYSFYIYSIAHSPWIFIPFLYVIFVNVKSTDIWCISCVNYWSFIFLVLVNWVPYFFS